MIKGLKTLGIRFVYFVIKLFRLTSRDFAMYDMTRFCSRLHSCLDIENLEPLGASITENFPLSAEDWERIIAQTH